MLVQRSLLRSVRLKTRLLARSHYASKSSCDRKTQSSFSVIYLGLTADTELLGKLHTELHSSDTAPSILTSSFLSSQNSRFKIETKRSNYFLCCTFQCGLDQHSGYSHSLRGGQSWDRIPETGRFSASVQMVPGAHSASYKLGTGSFPGVRAPGVSLTTHPHLVPRLKKEQSHSSTPSLGLRDLFEGEPAYLNCLLLVTLFASFLNYLPYVNSTFSRRSSEYSLGNSTGVNFQFLSPCIESTACHYIFLLLVPPSHGSG